MKTFFKVVVSGFITGVIASLLSGCSVSQEEPSDVAAFYQVFVEDATSLDSERIQAVYAELAEENFMGQESNDVREKIFDRFNSINPDLFSKIHFDDSTYQDSGTVYSRVLLLSIAAKDSSVDITVPEEAVTVSYDDILKMDVYEIDRKEIEITFPDSLGVLLDRQTEKSLKPVRIVKVDGSLKVVADGNMLTEVGIPLSNKIEALNK